MARAVLVRHGESQANADGLFTGVLDVPLSASGVQEAHYAAALLAGMTFAAAFTSELERAWRTAEIIAADLPGLPPPLRDWRLDERNYGGLTTRTKSSVLAEVGEAQFLAWRRSVNVPPPPMGDELYDRLAATPLFRALPPGALVRTESLADVMARVEPFWRERVEPVLRAGGDVLVVAHGNSLRALCGVVGRLREEEIQDLGLPTGHPLVFDFDGAQSKETGLLVPSERLGRYLDEPAARVAAEKLRREGGT